MKNNYKELLEKYGSPLYVYEYDILMDRCQKMSDFKNYLEKNINKKVNMHYSTKANNNPAILKVIKEHGIYVDCMSPLELSINQKCGFKNYEILYVCNNITKEEMSLVNKNNILICLDSISQVETWGSINPNTEIMIRINPNTKGVGHSSSVVTSGKETKFGITEDNFSELFSICKQHNLKIIGIHQHLGSLFLNDKVNDYIAGVKAGLDIIKNDFKDIKIIDLGGGFGVPYMELEDQLDLIGVADELIAVLNPFIDSYPSVEEFKFEPGRFIPCEAGLLIGTVTALKHENNTWWIGTDIGMNELVRPSMYDAYHHVKVLTNNTEEITANVCGNICESGDVLAKKRVLIKPNIGDIIIVENAGAYGYSMASNYTGRLRPAEVMLYSDSEKLIRKRETIEYLESNIIW